MTVRFGAVRSFKGAGAKEMIVRGDGCHVPFKTGETWLVYARERDGLITTGSCSRTRLLTEAVQDIAYLEGLEQGRRQGILYGGVYRRIVKADGQPALQGMSEPFHVVAAGAGGRLTATTDQWGPYQLVLPPGDYEVWAEREGRAVTPRHSVSIAHAEERRLQLAAEFESGGDAQSRPDGPALALERAESKWRERGPRSYTYGVMLTCFCSPKGMDFRVVAGRVQLPDKPTAATKGFHDAYGTIEALFERIRRAIDAGGHRVNVKYHDELGYPISADLDPRRDVIDDEVFIRVTGFRALPERR